MASFDILYYNPLNLKNKIKKIEPKKIFCGSSKIFKNISWLINMPKIFHEPHKNPLGYLMYGPLENSVLKYK